MQNNLLPAENRTDLRLRHIVYSSVFDNNSTPLRKRALKSNFFKGKISFKICLKKKKETEKRQRGVEKRTKIGRKVEIMNIRYHAIASIRNENK